MIVPSWQARIANTAGSRLLQSARAFAVGGPNASELIVRHTSMPQPKPAADGPLPFGKIYTDHYLTIRWTSRRGWEAPQVEPFRHLNLHPASLAFNHGQACFEGMKAFLGCDGHVRLFRPELNMRRLERSATRLGFPNVDGTQVLECIKQLLRVDREWVPTLPGSCLYIRPVLLECGQVIGTFEPTECLLFAFCSPSGSYFGPGGIRPIRMMLNETDVRAAPGGVGWCKHSGNYAPTFVPVKNARAKGCAQVLFTSGGFVGECAAMNVFFLIETEDGSLELVTPPLDDGTILPGVTRQSVLDLARAGALSQLAPMGLQVSERPLPVAELRAVGEAGKLVEVFGSGTAVVVQPVESLALPEGGEVRMRSTSFGEHVLSCIQDIQYYRTPHEWSIAVT